MEQSKSTAKNKIVKELKFEDVEDYVKIPKDITDKELQEYIKQNQINSMKQTIKKLNNDISVFNELWPDATTHQIFFAYEDCKHDVEVLAVKIAEESYREEIKKKIEERYEGKVITNEEEDVFEDKNDKDYTYCPKKSKNKSGIVVKSGGISGVKSNSKNKQVSNSDSESDKEPEKKKRKIYDTNVINDKYDKKPDDISLETWQRWSPAKRRSYNFGLANPNAYFYRHVAPGEEYKTGPFTKHEKELFLARVKEYMKPDGSIHGEWGLFSRAIPGRVGYQCSNFYRKLIIAGELTDTKYKVDKDGKLHHESHFRPGDESAGESAPPKKSYVRKKKHKDDDYDLDIELIKSKPVKPEHIRSILFMSSRLSQEFSRRENDKTKNNAITTQTTRTVTPKSESSSEVKSSDEKLVPSIEKMSKYERYALQNPIPGWCDPITSDDMKVPAISPDLTLLDYKTWLSVLQVKQEDPYTRRKMTKRDLIILTVENWKEYEDKIYERYSNCRQISSPLYE